MSDDPCATAALPPFYRGAKGEWDAPYCDRIIESGNGYVAASCAET